MCKCKKCGYENDSLLTNCLYCKSPLERADTESIKNEVLVMEASKWVETVRENHISVGDGHIFKHRIVSNGEISGIALQYLSILSIRATTNILLKNVYEELRQKYDKNKKAQKFSVRLIVTLGILGELFLIFLWWYLTR